MLLSSHWPIAASGAPLGDLFGCDSEALPFRLVLSPNPERASLLISGVGALSRWLTGNAKLLPVLTPWVHVFNHSVIVNFILYLIAGGPGDAREPLLLCGDSFIHATRSFMLLYPFCSASHWAWVWGFQRSSDSFFWCVLLLPRVIRVLFSGYPSALLHPSYPPADKPWTCLRILTPLSPVFYCCNIYLLINIVIV